MLHTVDGRYQTRLRARMMRLVRKLSGVVPVPVSVSVSASALGALTLAALLGATGCAPELGGRASFPVLSRATLPGYFEPIAAVDEKRCTHNVLFLVTWGDDTNHEALVTD